MKTEKNNHNSAIKNGYWLTIEPYVFIFKGKDEYILFNTLSKNVIDVDTGKDSSVVKLLEKLRNIDNLYSIELSEHHIEDSRIQNFISHLRNGFFGDIIPKSLFNIKPVTIPPIVRIDNSIQNINKYVELQKHNTYLGFLHELTVYLDGYCTFNCKFCDQYYKQFIFCTKTNECFSEQDIDLLLLTIQNSKISKLNLTGGNILIHKKLKYILNNLKTGDIEICLYIHYKNCLSSLMLEMSQYENVKFHILISDYSDEDVLYTSLSEISSIQNTVYDFVCKQESDYEKIQNIIGKFNISAFNIYPFYNGNINFFKNFVFNSKEEILDGNLSSKDIFAKQSINIYYYGKMTILPNKKIYADVNSRFIGYLKDNILDLIKRTLKSNSPWFKTRDKLEICKDCAYCFLCPSPSNYEKVIGKSNLCHVKS